MLQAKEFSVRLSMLAGKMPFQGSFQPPPLPVGLAVTETIGSAGGGSRQSVKTFAVSNEASAPTGKQVLAGENGRSNDEYPLTGGGAVDVSESIFRASCDACG